MLNPYAESDAGHSVRLVCDFPGLEDYVRDIREVIRSIRGRLKGSGHIYIYMYNIYNIYIYIYTLT